MLRYVQSDKLEPSFKIFARVGHIQRMLFEQWSVLETLTPNEYLEFRDALGQASGLPELPVPRGGVLLGMKERKTLRPFKHVPALHAELDAPLESPRFYDEFLRYLSRKGHADSRQTVCSATGASPTSGATRCWRSSVASTRTPRSTGTRMRCARSWWTLKSAFSSGATAT